MPLPRSTRSKSITAERDEYVTVPEVEVAAATIAAVAEEPAPRPTHPFVPPPRPEFGRLFAKLRRGL